MFDQVLKELEAAWDDYAEAGQEKVRTHAEFERLWHSALATSKGKNAQQRESDAFVSSAVAKRKWELAEVVYKAAQKKIDLLLATLTAQQTAARLEGQVTGGRQ